MSLTAFPGKIFWQSKAREILSNLVVIRLFDKDMMLIGDCVTANKASEFQWDLFEAKHIRCFNIGTPPEEVTEGFISPNLWTCKCRTNFIKSKLFTSCPYCGVSLGKAPKRLTPIDEIIHWAPFFIDAREYKLDPQDSEY